MKHFLRINKNKILLIYPLYILIISGCINPFAPPLTDKEVNINLIITEQKTPDEVLTNFSYAYSFKDSLIYSDLLDSSFLFISKNYATNPVTDLTWGRDTDIKTTVGLFRHFQSLNLVWGIDNIYEYEIDSITVELKKIFQLTLISSDNIPTINGEAYFRFIKNKSGIWKIKLWEDLAI
jgi:hypothetical protein